MFLLIINTPTKNIPSHGVTFPIGRAELAGKNKRRGLAT